MQTDLYIDSPSAAQAVWFGRTRTLARRLLRLPGFSLARPWAAVASAVATPAGKITFQPEPDRPAGDDGHQLTILSANLYHDWPRFRRLSARLEAVAQLVEREAADVLLLQEVARTMTLDADRWLAERLGMAHVYARANGHQRAIGFEEGLAIYSRYPLQRPMLTQLGQSGNPFSRRLGLGVELRTFAGSLPVFSVHLGLTAGHNTRQLDHLHQWVTEQVGGQTALIGGDFNAHETAKRMKRTRLRWLDTYRHLYPHGDGTTHALRLPWGWSRRRLDYQFLHGDRSCWQVADARHLSNADQPHSDHRAVVTRLRYNCGSSLPT